MVVIKDLLEEHNINLDLTEKALNLKFKGEFSYVGIEKVMVIEPEPICDYQEVDGIVFMRDENTKLIIVPDDPEYIIRFYYNSPSPIDSNYMIRGVAMFGYDGMWGIMEPVLENWMYSEL